jgi:trehalose 6-phosphate synthase
MSRLVVVANRVAEFDKAGAASKGGLAMALSGALRANGGMWFGWSGMTAEQPTATAGIKHQDGIDVATLDLDAQDVDEYYNGFANRTLWPLFHYRMDLTSYERSYGSAYVRVNARFADALVPLLREDDTLWVHDYHLIPLARELRKRGIRNRIGFFLHIPWPARQLLATLPRHHELVQSMFDYDLIGFQTEGCRGAFRDYVTGELKGEEGEGHTLRALGRTIEAGAYPIGLDVAEMHALVRSEAARQTCATMQAVDQKMLIGVDRIDYSKGLPEKFAGYEQFLIDHPQWREKLFMLQIGQPSRTEVEAYRDLNDDLESQAGRINGAFGSLDWSPLRYRTQSMPRDVLAGAYRAAAAAVVTPLRDGMNLVAKEYVACQDPEDPGVLILSRFAGAAGQMREALLVNPHSREDLADAIRRAIEMPRAERIVRWKALHAGIAREDLTAWRENFLGDLMQRRSAGEDVANSRIGTH